jgi:hypothetical protein
MSLRITKGGAFLVLSLDAAYYGCNQGVLPGGCSTDYIPSLPSLDIELRG